MGSGADVGKALRIPIPAMRARCQPLHCENHVAGRTLSLICSLRCEELCSGAKARGGGSGTPARRVKQWQVTCHCRPLLSSP